MRGAETIQFDPQAYAAKLHHPSYSYEILQANIYKKRAQIVSASSSLGIAAAAAIPSHGLSVIPGVYAGRNLHVEFQKLELLEREWAYRGLAKLPDRKRDFFVPMGIAAATATVGLGMTAGLDSAGAVAVGHAGSQAVHSLEHSHGLMANAHSAVTSFGHGVKHGFEQTVHALASNGHAQYHMAPLNFSIPASTNAVGFVAGMEGTKAGLDYAAGKVIGTSAMHYVYDTKDRRW